MIVESLEAWLLPIRGRSWGRIQRSRGVHPLPRADTEQSVATESAGCHYPGRHIVAADAFGHVDNRLGARTTRLPSSFL